MTSWVSSTGTSRTWTSTRSRSTARSSKFGNSIKLDLPDERAGMSGDSVQPEYISQVRDPETGDWSQGGPLSEDLNHAPSTELAKLNDMGDYGKNGFPPNL